MSFSDGNVRSVGVSHAALSKTGAFSYGWVVSYVGARSVRLWEPSISSRF